jgi:ribosomal protein L17
MTTETTISKAERMVENMLISMAIQDAINAKAIKTTPEQEEMLDMMIAELAKQFKPAES